jgi:UDP-N-acetylmuramoyl-L-alanyl-D-glutamate--2,6-diaminopimelate ligase
MKLNEIIRDCGVLSVQGSTDLEITGLTSDSRRVRPGSLFIAVNGCGNEVPR